MTHLIDKDAVVAEIERRLKFVEKRLERNNSYSEEGNIAWERDKSLYDNYNKLLSFTHSLEVKEVDLYNNGWIDCTKQMPQEKKQTSDTLQGHREWTESDMVLVWDSMYGCSVDVTKNGKWMSEQIGNTGQLVHGIIAWRPIPEFSEELLLKAQKGE